jgi:hypothetical protein
LDIAIGLMFTFLAISLIASTATEAVSSAMSWRADTLFKGVKDLLNDQQFTGLARQVYNHGLVNALSKGDAKTAADLSVKPSYIDPKQFASALIDVVELDPNANISQLKTSIDDKIQDQQLKDVLNGIVDRTNGNLNRIHDEIAAWFNQGMERISGSYKRKTQLWSLIIALIIAILLNIDAIRIAEALWNQPMLLKGLAPPQQTGETAKQALDQLNDLHIPFGWNDGALKDFFKELNWLYVIPGWVISAIATLFGAPFWFDTLQRFVKLRGTGSNPAEKASS